jgi:hypothetical protein
MCANFLLGSFDYPKEPSRKKTQFILSHQLLRARRRQINKLTRSVIRTICAWSEPPVSVFRNDIVDRISDKSRHYNKYIE